MNDNKTKVNIFTTIATAFIRAQQTKRQYVYILYLKKYDCTVPETASRMPISYVDAVPLITYIPTYL